MQVVNGTFLLNLSIDSNGQKIDQIKVNKWSLCTGFYSIDLIYCLHFKIYKILNNCCNLQQKLKYIYDGSERYMAFHQKNVKA